MWMSVAAAVVALGFVWIFNSLVRRKNDVETCWGAIDSYLKKRFDLVPNLVSSVQNYMTHEKDTLEKLVRLREQSMKTGWSPEAAVRSDADVASALRQVMARAEAYPELKANQNFLQLQAALNEIEEQLSAARRAYNSSVSQYNNGVEMLPHRFVAGLLGYQRKPVLETVVAEKVNHDVNALFQRKSG